MATKDAIRRHRTQTRRRDKMETALATQTDGGPFQNEVVKKPFKPAPTAALATTFVVEDGSCANCASLITDENTKAMITDRETVDATELTGYIRKSMPHVK